MKKTILAPIILFAVLGCSSEKGFGNSGQCIVCKKPTEWNSIGYCKKHYDLKKEQTLRGVEYTVKTK